MTRVLGLGLDVLFQITQTVADRCVHLGQRLEAISGQNELDG